MKTPMPVEVFPASVRVFIERVAEAALAPVELSGMLALSALATAVHRRVQVQIDDDWIEETTIYTMIVIETGGAKSPVFKHLMKPFHDWERSQKVELEIKTRLYEALSDQEKRDTPKPPPSPPRMVVSDITPEKLAVLMSLNDERMAVLADEGAILDILSGRYAPKGMTASLDLFLNSWNGARTTIDRQKEGASVVLDRPCLSIGLTVQPTVLEKLAQAEYLRERGLLARFLIAVPESKVGQRVRETVRSRRPKADQLMRSNWATLISELMAIADGTVLQISDDAFRLIMEYANSLELRINGDLANIKEVSNKAISQIARIAALLHLAHDPHARILEMGASEIEQAITLYDWLIQHHHAAQAISTTLSPQARAFNGEAGYLARPPSDGGSD